MSSVLKSVVFGSQKPFYDKELDLNIDLTYITSKILVCSGPVNNYPNLLYRNSINDIVKFLKCHYQNNWLIINLRGENPGYNDTDVNNKILHFPFADHQPPPFHLLPKIVQSVKNFLNKSDKNIILIHCKAGKGRTGTIVSCILISNHNFSYSNSLNLFTQKRMRSGFGDGVSILSQRRYIKYYYNYVKSSSLPDYIPFYNPIYFKCNIEYIRIIKPYYEIDISIYDYDLKNTNDYKKLYTFNNGEDIIHKSNDFVTYSLLFKKNKNIKNANSKFIRKIGPDIRLSLEQKFSFNKKKLLTSSTFFWFNTFFESFYDASKNLWKFDEDLIKSNKIKGSIKLNWNQLDGYKGTTTKGLKLFESIEIYWNFNDLNSFYKELIKKSKERKPLISSNN
ncbi:putative phosphatidylinositol-3,4,5-trisphosphate 3-phosphatase [Ascoidea rubescens DSM 1968]|uniref:phosphatidylinositol-3,4,5-trisphosphate 3-phosphatase n=1 Tax=Ascoidea rubescens DSM 1968 TaxID=1344418 RepID=A0A1D2VDT7_9ASCO|nr:phosphatases II [Ascoidea rubescens DSM 1968]ODV59854.1 phosphatases II [Ascoidea rubescens DSM 1968]